MGDVSAQYLCYMIKSKFIHFDVTLDGLWSAISPEWGVESSKKSKRLGVKLKGRSLIKTGRGEVVCIFILQINLFAAELFQHF